MSKQLVQSAGVYLKAEISAEVINMLHRKTMRIQATRSKGGWISVMLAVAAINLLAETDTHSHETELATSAYQAGPIDDTLKYIQCLINLLQGIPCDHSEPGDPGDPPPMPDEPPS